MNEARDNRELDDILERALDDLLLGRKTLADCLAEYPDYADDLKPVLQAAAAVSLLDGASQMSAEAVDALETRLLTIPMPVSVSARPSTRIIRLPVAISRMAAVIAIVFVLAFGGGAGLVSASASSMPGDTLYGIKRLWESIVVALAPLTGPLDELWLHIAETRLEEVEYLAEQGRLTEEALTDLHRAIYWASIYRDADIEARLLTYLARVRTSLTAIIPPLEAQPVYSDVLAVAEQSVLSGIVQTPPSELPPSRAVQPPVATPLFIPSLTPSTTPSLTLPPVETATPTLIPTDGPSPTPTESRTPTPSRTPTLTPTPTYTPSPTYTPTSTWTPIPLPVFPTPGTARPTLPPGIIPTSTPFVPPTVDATRRVRETQQSVYLTQTAGPGGPTPTAAP